MTGHSGRGARRGIAAALAGALAVSAFHLSLAPAALAVGTLCGYLESGGRPVRGASVLAADEGRVAHSDSTGLFCLTDLRGRTQRLQILALGFAPVERFLPVGEETLLVELVPLRTLSTASVAPAKQSRIGWDLTKDVPEFVTPSDSSALNGSDPAPAGLHALLSDSAAADSVTRRGSWRAVAEVAAAGWTRDCSEGKKRAPERCSYWVQAETVAWVRAALVERDDALGRRARESLARLRETRSGLDFEAWAARIEALLPH